MEDKFWRLRRLAPYFLFTVICMFNFSDAGAVDVSGRQSGVWTTAASPYTVIGDVLIPYGERLEIQPGVVIFFAGKHSFKVNGTLIAVGHPVAPIVFTTANDREYILEPSSAGKITPDSYWDGLQFLSGSERSVLQDILIKYSYRALEVVESTPTLLNIRAKECLSNVVFINGQEVAFQNGKPLDFYGARDHLLLDRRNTSNGDGLQLASKSFADIDQTKKPAILDEPEFTFGEITVITASKRAEPISAAPAVIDVITGEEIQNMGAKTLEDAVMYLTGIQTPMSRKGHSRLWVRGLGARYNNKSLLLMNGYPLRRLWFGHHPMDEELLLENVERIEVIRGPGSALYGANALAGVINVITKEPDQNSDTAISATAGNKQTANLSLNFNNKSDLGSIGGSMSFFDSRGDLINLDKYAHENLKYDERTTIALEGKAKVGNFILGGLYNRYKSQYRTEEFSEEIHYDKVQQFLTLEYDHEFSNKVAIASKNYFNRFIWTQDNNIYDEIIIQNIGQNINNRLDIRSDRFFDSIIAGSDLQATWQSASNNSLLAGLNFEQERLRDFFEISRFNWYGDNLIFNDLADRDDLVDDYGGDFDAVFNLYDLAIDSNNDGIIDDTLYVAEPQVAGARTEYVTKKLPIVNNNVAFYLQDTWDIVPGAKLIAGFRLDNHDTYGLSFSPRSGLVLQPDKKTSLKLLYNRAFRAPAYFELYVGRADDDNPGNIDLKPERIQALDIELNYQLTKRLNAKIGLFHEEISDFITAVGGDTITNLGTRQSRGIELGMQYRPKKNVHLFANVSLMQVRDMDAQELALVWRTPEQDRSKYDLVPTGEIKDLEVPSVAPFLANFGINFGMLRYVNINLMTHYEGRRNRPVDYHANMRNKYGQTEFFLQDNLGGYFMTNLTLTSQNFLEPLKFSLIIRNVFDSETFNPAYEPAKYYDIRRNRRSILVKTSYSF